MKDSQVVHHELVINLFDSFVRVYPIPFDEHDFIQFARISGIDCIPEEIAQLLRDCSVVYRLPDGKYLSRGKTLEEVYFSIKPSRFEIEQGILILGDRCMPYMDPSMVPEGFEVYYKRCKTPLQRKILALPTSEVLEHYKLFGEEYAIQYINMDSCNKDIDLAGYDFSLPPEINLSVLDLNDLYNRFDFHYGDRFLLRTKSFLEGRMDIEVLCDHRINPFIPTSSEEEREQWYQVLEGCLLETFECFGPCRSMDEQLAYAVMLGMNTLNSKNCGSITEFMEWTEKVTITEFGVESRLWYADRPISVVSPSEDGQYDEDTSVEEELDVASEFGIPVSDLVLQAFVHDSLWRQEEDGKGIYSRLILNDDMILPEQADLLKLRLKKLHSILKGQYNRFTDVSVGSVRHAAVRLYAQLLEFVCYMSQSKVPAEMLPQQDFVIFSQIWGHISKMIEQFEIHQDLDGKDCANASKSIEGMSWSAADVSPRLRRAVDDWKRQGFSYI